jgi:hypothetical protein
MMNYDGIAIDVSMPENKIRTNRKKSISNEKIFA